jgi:DNA adenine methylase
VEWRRCKKTWFEDYLDPVEQARRWFVVTRCSFSGDRYGGMKMNVTAVRSIPTWLNVINLLPEIALRFKQVQVDCADFRKILKRYDTPATLFYLDPPYVKSTRKGGGYFHELTLVDHEDLVKQLLKIKGKAILSGYRHFVYEDLIDAGWLAVTYKVTCDAVGRTRANGLIGKKLPKNHQREEMLYISPSCFSRRIRKVIC